MQTSTLKKKQTVIGIGRSISNVFDRFSDDRSRSYFKLKASATNEDRYTAHFDRLAKQPCYIFFQCIINDTELPGITFHSESREISFDWKGMFDMLLREELYLHKRKTQWAKDPNTLSQEPNASGAYLALFADFEKKDHQFRKDARRARRKKWHAEYSGSISNPVTRPGQQSEEEAFKELLYLSKARKSHISGKANIVLRDVDRERLVKTERMVAFLIRSNNPLYP